MTPWSKRLAILLAVSIGLNLLLAGMMIGRSFARPRGERFGPRGPDAGVAGEWRGGREERRHPLLRDAIERRRSELSARREGIEAARRSVRETITREPFERAALEAALLALRAETAKSQELLHAALVEGAEKANAEQRRSLARSWDSKPRRGKR